MQPVQLFPGQNIILSASFPPLPFPNKYFVQAKLFYKGTLLAIGDPNWIQDGTKTFSFAVTL